MKQKPRHMGTPMGSKGYYYWKCICGERMMGTTPTKTEAIMRLAHHVNRIPEKSGGEFDRAIVTLEQQGVLFTWD